MIFLAKNEDRYQAVKDALNDLNPVVRGVVVIKPDLPAKDTGPGGFTQISFVRAAVDWIREHGAAKRIYIAESASEGSTAELFRTLGYTDFLTNLKNAKNIDLIDCNLDKGYEMEFVDARGEKMMLPVSRTVLDADFILSLSLLKTHDQVAFSGSIRNLEGFIVGAENKIKMHGFAGKKPHEMNDGELSKGARAFSENLLDLYQLIEPDLAIIDGNGQEGNGPVRGTPKTTDLVVAGDDCLKLDVVAAELMGFTPESVPYIRLADESGLNPFEGIDEVRGLNPEDVKAEFAPHKRAAAMQFPET